MTIKSLFVAGLAVISLSVHAEVETVSTPSEWAQVVRHFDIPVQPLAQALMVFGEQAATAVVAPSALTANKMARSVKGDLRVVDAVNQLLDGSQLHYVWRNNGTVLIIAQ